MMNNHVEKLQELDWFHPNTDRHVAETLLIKNGEEGAYLLRNRRRGEDGEFVLSVRTKDAVKHFEVKIINDELNFGFGTFSCVEDFVAHFETQPLIAGESGVLTVIRFPYPRVVEEPGIYDRVRIHASVGKNRSIREHKELSVASKEGYLTKRGGTIKNWKKRWFTLQKNELKYFKERSDKEPIRILDLTDCSEVQQEDSIGKDNCFKLKFSWRTFYIYSATKEEMEEWVKLIEWKLKSIKTKKHQTI